ncbi:MAG: hypothetical protein ACPG8W_13085 [Candidatus Promineifilaceae bacterium]
MTLARKSPFLIQDSAERFAVYEPTADDVELALSTSVASALPSTSLGLAIMYMLLSASHGMLLPSNQRDILLPIAVLSALFFLAFYFSNSANTFARHGHAMAGMFGLVALVNSVVHLAISADPLQSSNIMLVMLATSAFFLSSRWFAAVMTLSVVSWAAVAMSNQLSDMWMHFGIAFAMALLTSVIIHRVRVRAYISLHRLRLQHDRQVTQLQDARQLLQAQIQKRTNELASMNGSLSKQRISSEIRETMLQGRTADLTRKALQLEQKYGDQIRTLKAENRMLTDANRARTNSVNAVSHKLNLSLITAQSTLEMLQRMLESRLTVYQTEAFGRVTDSLVIIRDSAEKLRGGPKMKSALPSPLPKGGGSDTSPRGG